MTLDENDMRFLQFVMNQNTVMVSSLIASLLEVLEEKKVIDKKDFEKIMLMSEQKRAITHMAGGPDAMMRAIETVDQDLLKSGKITFRDLLGAKDKDWDKDLK